jgi:hypothetical protein
MRAEIPIKHAKYALERLHAELGGKIKDNRADARRLAECMKHIEAVLKMIEPGYSARFIAVRRRKPNPWFKRGTIFRLALSVLWLADEPLTTRQIVERMLAERGIANASQKAIAGLGGSIRASLQNHDRKTVMRAGNGIPERWSIIK